MMIKLVVLMVDAAAADSSVLPAEEEGTGRVVLAIEVRSGPAAWVVFHGAEQMQHSRGLNVLIVAEGEGLAVTLSPPLRADGHIVGDVSDGVDAIAAARSLFPDVVLVDADLASLDVPALTHEIGGLSARRRPFFIALAGREVQECPPPPAESGVDLYLAKPAALSRIRDLLKRFQAVAVDFESFDPVI